MGSSEDPYYNRRLRGTRVYHMRHRIVLSVMAAGGLIGTIIHFLPGSQVFSRLVLEDVSKEHQYMQEKRMRLKHSLLSSSSSETIREEVKESEDRCM